MFDISEETGISHIISFYGKDSEGVIEVGELIQGDYFKSNELHTFYVVGPTLYKRGEYYRVVFRYPSMENCFMFPSNYVKKYKPNSEQIALIAPFFASGTIWNSKGKNHE